jgi:hypothetical protein
MSLAHTPAAGAQKFSQGDSEKVVQLLNIVATKAEFNGLDVKQIIAFTKLLNWAQTELLPKIDANIFEVVSVTPPSKKK